MYTLDKHPLLPSKCQIKATSCNGCGYPQQIAAALLKSMAQGEDGKWRGCYPQQIAAALLKHLNVAKA